MNIPTELKGVVENKRLVITSWSSLPRNWNSTPPAVLGVAKALAQMSLKAFDSRGARVNWICGATAGQAAAAVGTKQRYVAVTVRAPHTRC